MKTTLKPSPLRREIGRTACYEVGLLADMLRAYIERHDPGGESSPAMRGGLLRLTALSEIIYQALIIDDPEATQSDKDLIEAIGGHQCLGTPDE
jgi:hypothetical protein